MEEKNMGNKRNKKAKGLKVMSGTIQPQVEKMSRDTAQRNDTPKSTPKSTKKRKPLSVPKRPSKARGTDAKSGACEICGSNSWDTDSVRGETLCADCGYVAAENMIDPGAEWVNHSDSADRSRVGAPSSLTLHDKGLSTEISRADLTSGGAARYGMNGRNLREWRRRQRIDQRSKTRDSRSRNLTQAMQFIRDRGDLPKQIEQEAASLYRHSVDKGLVTGRSIRGVSAACVYIAARQAQIPRRIDVIAEAFDMISEVEQKELKRTIRLVARTMNTHHITGPEEYFEKFHSDLGLPPYVLGQTRDIWDSVKEDLSWQGKKPSGIAGCMLYKASQDSTSPRTQSEVCKVSGISEVTLRGLLKILNQMLLQQNV
jgi:transcription initiation factor TFIIB